jgi:tRNA/rRNA methyltransferase
MKSPAIVLVRPRNPRNIGAAARVLSNFGFDDLRVVAAHPPVWEEARRAATDGAPLLKRARLFGSLEEALSDRDFVWGTTCLKGRAVKARALPEARIPAGHAVVFGQEKRGLSGADLAVCDALLTIPTAAACPSMNLAQSVAIVCYEISRRPARRGEQPRRVPFSQVENFVSGFERALRAIGYRPSMTSEARRAKVRSLLRRRGIAVDEAGFLREVLRRAEEFFKTSP